MIGCVLLIRDLTGLKFGRLTVVSFVEIRRRYAWWSCFCECGKVIEARGSRLVIGSTRSCGCLRLEVLKANGALNGALNRTHGMSNSPEYNSWQALIQRCTNPKRRAYHRYGGRGIKVTLRWIGPNGFTNFLADVGPKPGPEYSIDRFPDNDGDYSPENCRWATMEEQNNNRNDNVNREVSLSG